MKRAIIFDMDGVMADTERTRFDLLKEISARRGYALKEEDYRKTVGIKTRAFLKELLPGITPSEIEKIRLERKRLFYSNPSRYILARPRIRNLCKRLHANGFMLSVASMSERKDIGIILDELHISGFFTNITSCEDVKNGKPEPDIYLKAVAKTGLKKKECIAIEDSPTGIKSAKKAGIACIAVTFTYSRKELNGADAFADSLEDIEESIK